ncbi:hypothetical protein KUTeg_015732 [Tegillarca granosa]|uniref:Uncharacterized protein n=1 Tax=Tegillarca granosa TaxID=220873 RepID=A0ABQ9EQP9_TEGGR|nr:hypothetical protein KUTeg_015732 [Tegillarca granosa]
MKLDILSLSKLPNTTVAWSCFLPRLFWYCARSQVAIENVRKRTNREISSYILKLGDLSDKETGCYRFDGIHLSDIGNDIYLNALQGALESFLIKDIQYIKLINKHDQKQFYTENNMIKNDEQICLKPKKGYGTEYEPDILKPQKSTLHRYLKQKNYECDILQDFKFQHLREVLAARRKHLKTQENGNRSHRAEKLTLKDTESLYKHIDTYETLCDINIPPVSKQSVVDLPIKLNANNSQDFCGNFTLETSGISLIAMKMAKGVYK